MKNKSVVRHGSKRSGKPPGGYWMPQGPFGNNSTMLARSITAYGPEGFSLAGSTRNVGYVGQSMGMSKSGTPFRGVHPMGSGGCCGTYKTPMPTMNSNQVIVQGNQYLYVKPSVLSQRGMLQKKFKYIYNGQYPNYFVKDVYTGNKTDNASQGVYLDKLSAANTCSRGFWKKNPVDSSVQLLRIQRKCANPSPEQRPFPVPDNGNGQPCGAAIPATLM